nr:MAG TPA: hypothetical protein [Crassvirales sp.]
MVQGLIQEVCYLLYLIMFYFHLMNLYFSIRKM